MILYYCIIDKLQNKCLFFGGVNLNLQHFEQSKAVEKITCLINIIYASLFLLGVINISKTIVK